MNSNLLEPVWKSYQTTLDCLRIADRSIQRGEQHLLKNTSFISSELDVAKRVISQSKDDAGDFVILSMWALFERSLVAALRDESQRILRLPATDFNSRLHEKISNDIEFWKSVDILDLFKSLVSEDLLMKVKQIKKYRDWIAHKNPNKPVPANVIPQTAYEILSVFVGEIAS